MLHKLNTAQKRGLLSLLGILILLAGWRWNAFRTDSKPSADVAQTEMVQKAEPQAPTKFDLNTADSTQLRSVSGIGATLASRIIRFRKRIGGFQNTEQLLQITGIRDGNFVAIEERVFADTTTAAYAQLQENKPKRKYPYRNRRSYYPKGQKRNWSKRGAKQSTEAEASIQQESFSGPAKPNYPPRKKYPIEPIDINVADSASLVTVSGIGPGTARNIVMYRKLIFFFTDLSQLEEVWGVRPKNLERMLPQLKIEAKTDGMDHLRINEMSVEELAKHKYMDFKTARILVAYREKHGAFEAFEDFNEVLGISPKVLEKLKPYFKY